MDGGPRTTDHGPRTTDGIVHRPSSIVYHPPSIVNRQEKEYTPCTNSENLEIWHLAVDYIDLIYALTQGLPRHEDYNLKAQIRRAATSVALNVAEGSTGQTDAEQARFLGLALRSLIETVACQHLIHRRGYLAEAEPLRQAYQQSQILARKLQAMRNALAPEKPWLREEFVDYDTHTEPPF